MAIIIKDIDMPLGCVYEDKKGNTQYCPLCNHEDIPYCTLELIKMPMEGLHFIEIDSRPEWCLLSAFEEPQKGKWEIYATFGDCYYARCDQCHETQVFYYDKQLTNFCPNCGADMEDKYDEYFI